MKFISLVFLCLTLTGCDYLNTVLWVSKSNNVYVLTKNGYSTDNYVAVFSDDGYNLAQNNCEQVRDMYIKTYTDGYKFNCFHVK